MSCGYCGGPIPEKRVRAHAKYCKTACQKAVARERYRITSGCKPQGEMASGTVGAIGELLVAVDLLEKGYEVFRALSPACSCDLVVYKGGRGTRVEVKVRQPNADHRADVLAVVAHGVITYKPDLSS